MAAACFASRVEWREHELAFLDNISRFGSSWPALSERQAKWIRDLHQRAMCAAEAA